MFRDKYNKDNVNVQRVYCGTLNTSKLQCTQLDKENFRWHSYSTLNGRGV